MNKKILAAALAAVLLLPVFAPANGFNLNGLGSRAQSMGGAFVGLADDFSAVFWNPAGAAGFRKEMFGFCAIDLMPRATYRFAPEITIPEFRPIDAKTPIAHHLGFLGGYYRPVGEKVVLGLGVGTTSGLGTLWDGADLVDFMGETAYEWSNTVRRISLSPMAAVRISEAIAVGIAVNVDYGSFSLKMPAGFSTWPVYTVDGGLAGLRTAAGSLSGAVIGAQGVDLGQYEENMNGWGIGATLGVLIKPVETLSLGLTVRTPSTITFDGAARMSNLSLYEFPGSSDLERKITWPLWIAGGISFRPVPRLLLSADVHWTQWSKLDVLRTEFMDPQWRPFTEAEGRDVRVLNWKDTTQIRLGAEYMLSAKIALRAGYYRDPAPGPIETQNVLFPSHAFNAFTIGIGRAFGDLQLDFGLEYLAGVDRTVPDDGFDSAMPGTYGQKIIVPTASVSYRF